MYRVSQKILIAKFDFWVPIKTFTPFYYTLYIKIGYQGWEKYFVTLQCTIQPLQPIDQLWNP